MKAVIFDLDGVIVDTAKYHYLAWSNLANELGFTFTEQDNELLKGVSRVRSLEILLEIGNITLSQEDFDKYAAKKNDEYVKLISELTPEDILPGVKDFITRLKKSGYLISLGSASKNAVFILKHLELTPYFDSIVDGTHVSKAKPDPEVFLTAAKNLGIDPKECVVFEDAVAGVEAGKNASMRVIGVGEADVLSNADHVISTFENLSLDVLEA
ncbi:beta-phosphoglucomutase [Thiospirochaeta perfilievii]|uniref:Beta-phosphoglucomutase n=1 Tax=Thiospirochaeta perfilievii TaxID=252967 RepID=A0A5C1QDA7_9SPIO|nr:beta-phosphoglucomutase [Thiospirochaeta perfilievii]QEN05397.1 beta-phosphoglucomutase [Thiospirochaeta perfilievii]